MKEWKIWLLGILTKIEKTLWQKEKLLVLSNFFFCHYVYKTLSAAEASESIYMRERVNFPYKDSFTCLCSRRLFVNRSLSKSVLDLGKFNKIVVFHEHILFFLLTATDPPYKIDIFEDYLYVTTYKKHRVLKFNKFYDQNTNNATSMLRATAPFIGDILIYHSSKQFIQNTGKWIDWGLYGL